MSDEGEVQARVTTILATLAALCSVACLGAAGATAAGLVAPPGTCPEAPRGAAAEETTMLCLTNYARAQVGEGPLEPTAVLQDSAAEKAEDIVTCDSFSHFACGREFTYWIRANGYLATECWHVGENLAWGTGSYGTVNSIFRAWLRSTEHRENLLDARFTQVGIDLRVGRLEGQRGAHVWAQAFGSHC
ncbi:MAG: CAP domain-containing protein [Solirubrobacterales bacterium]